MSSQEAEEIRAAFGELAKGINRLGSALASIISNSGRNPQEVASQVAARFLDNTVATTQCIVSAPVKEKAGRKKRESSTEEPSAIQPLTAPPTPAVKEAGIKKTKDPNAPRKPMSSFLLYCRDNRDNLKAEHPDWPYVEITRALAAMWEKAVDKGKYEAEAARLNGIWKVEAQRYNRSKEEGLTSPLASTMTEEIVKEPVPAHIVDSTVEEPTAKKSKKEKSHDKEQVVKEKNKNKKKKEKATEAVSTSDAHTFIGDKGPLVPIPPLSQESPTKLAMGVSTSSEASASPAKKSKKNKKKHGEKPE